MTRKKKTLFALSIALVGFAMSGHAGAATIFSDFDGQSFDAFQPGVILVGLGVEGAAAGGANNGVPHSLAAAFTADNNYSLTRLDLGFLAPTQNAVGAMSVVVSIQSSLSGLPGGSLSSWTEDVPDNGLLTLNSSGVTLTKGAQYFLTVEPSNPFTNVSWALAGSSSTAPLFYEAGLGWRPADETIFPYGTYPLLSQASVAFDAVGSPSPVPLPAATWLLASGLLGLGALSRGKRRRTA